MKVDHSEALEEALSYAFALLIYATDNDKNLTSQQNVDKAFSAMKLKYKSTPFGAKLEEFRYVAEDLDRGAFVHKSNSLVYHAERGSSDWLRDWMINDVSILFTGQPTDRRFQKCQDYTARLATTFGKDNVRVCGHSLSGLLQAWNSILNGYKGHVFNQAASPFSSYRGFSTNVISHVTIGDQISTTHGQGLFGSAIVKSYTPDTILNVHAHLLINFEFLIDDYNAQILKEQVTHERLQSVNQMFLSGYKELQNQVVKFKDIDPMKLLNSTRENLLKSNDKMSFFENSSLLLDFPFEKCTDAVKFENDMKNDLFYSKLFHDEWNCSNLDQSNSFSKKWKNDFFEIDQFTNFGWNNRDFSETFNDFGNTNGSTNDYWNDWSFNVSFEFSHSWYF